MKLVVDANILFAALIKEGLTAELLISDKLHLSAPEFLFEEFSKYEELVLKKTNRSHQEFNMFFDVLKEQITIVSKDRITPFFKNASEFSPDPKDTVYLALAMMLECGVWSNDKKLKENQSIIEVYSTEDLLELQKK